MTYKIRVTTEAKIEIKEAKKWHENQSVGLGDTFTTEIKKAIRSLLNPQVDHKIAFTTHRRILLYKFPYTIYYKRDEIRGMVKVVAVLHNRQSQDRLKGRM